MGWVDLGWVDPVRVGVLEVDPCWGVGVRVGLGGIGVLRVVEVKGTPQVVSGTVARVAVPSLPI